MIVATVGRGLIYRPQAPADFSVISSKMIIEAFSSRAILMPYREGITVTADANVDTPPRFVAGHRSTGLSKGLKASPQSFRRQLTGWSEVFKGIAG